MDIILVNSDDRANLIKSLRVENKIKEELFILYKARTEISHSSPTLSQKDRSLNETLITGIKQLESISVGVDTNTLGCNQQMFEGSGEDFS